MILNTWIHFNALNMIVKCYSCTNRKNYSLKIKFTCSFTPLLAVKTKLLWVSPSPQGPISRTDLSGPSSSQKQIHCSWLSPMTSPWFTAVTYPGDIDNSIIFSFSTFGPDISLASLNNKQHYNGTIYNLTQCKHGDGIIIFILFNLHLYFR